MTTAVGIKEKAKVQKRLCQKLHIITESCDKYDSSIVNSSNKVFKWQIQHPTTFCVPLCLFNFDELSHLFHGQSGIIHSVCLRKQTVQQVWKSSYKTFCFNHLMIFKANLKSATHFKVYPLGTFHWLSFC